MANGTTALPTARLTWRNGALSLLTIIVLFLCLRMFRPFLPAIVGSIVLATVTHRPYVWLLAKIKHPASAASIATAAVTLSIILPGIVLLQVIVNYAISAASMLQGDKLTHSMNGLLDHVPQLANTLRHGSELLTLSQATEKLAGFLATNLVTALSNTVETLTQTVIMLFLLFFLYRDDRTFLRSVSELLPMTDLEIASLLHRIEETIRATFLGNFLIAAIQGVASGVIFAALGVGNAVALGVLAAAAAVIPYFGAYVVWLPVAIYLALIGHWIKMAILMAIGTLLISTLDNFLYPVLVGSQLSQHPASVLLSLLGGVWLFGISGLVLGPVIFSMAESLLAIWKQRMNGVSVHLQGSSG